MDITFVTGNQSKVDYLAKKLGRPVKHYRLDLVEIQSLDLHEVAEHKARQAYDKLRCPVLVEDVSLVVDAWGDLPGPLIKWFVEANSVSDYGLLSRLADAFSDRSATARLVYALYGGDEIHFFEGEMRGTIAKDPAGKRGWGWDHVFINDGQSQTRGELDEQTYDETSYRLKAINKLKLYLENETS